EWRSHRSEEGRRDLSDVDESARARRCGRFSVDLEGADAEAAVSWNGSADGERLHARDTADGFGEIVGRRSSCRGRRESRRKLERKGVQSLGIEAGVPAL